MANLNLNKVILAGRLVADPELKQTQSGIAVVSTTIAVNRRYAKQGEEQAADFITIVAWRQQAEFISRYFRKGSSICVTGSIQTRNWTDQQNQKRYATEVQVDEVMFVDSKGEGPAMSGQASFGSSNQDSFVAPAFANDRAAVPQFEEMSNDDDLPF